MDVLVLAVMGWPHVFHANGILQICPEPLHLMSKFGPRGGMMSKFGHHGGQVDETKVHVRCEVRCETK